MVGRAGEMLQLYVPGACYVRMGLHEARRVLFEDETRGCVIRVPRTTQGVDMYVCLENVRVLELYCDESDASELSFSYIY